MSAADVCAVVVNFNSGGDLDRCLPLLLAEDPAVLGEVQVVDNASQDGSDALARGWARREPRVRVLPSAVNRGYAGGVNLALATAERRYLAVLNPDVAPEPGWLAELVRFLDQHPEVAAANPLLLLGEPEDRINAAGQDIHVTGLGFNRLLGRRRKRAGTAPSPVAGLQGGAFVVRRALLEATNGWDESGFLYHEDVELSWLLRLMGHQIYCVPGAVARHDYHLTMDPTKFFLLERNRLALLRTHLGAAARRGLAPARLCTEGLTLAYCLLRGPSFLRAKSSAYRWLRGNRARLAARRGEVEALRRTSDLAILRRLSWRYDVRQFLVLGVERAGARRRRR